MMPRPDRRRARAWIVAAVLVAGVAAAAWLAAPTPSDGLPLSPDSTAADGTRALTQVLERLGAEVVVTDRPPGDATTGLLMVDNVDPATRSAWREVAARGGTLVVTDPASELTPAPVGTTGFGFLDPPLGRGCPVEALRDAARAQPGGGATYAVGEDAVGCFGRGEGHWLVVTPEGEGAIVAVGGPGFLTNAQLGQADNAVLAAALLAAGPSPVVAVAAPGFAAGDAPEGLAHLVPDRAWLLMLQLMAAFLALVWWRSRRVGAPVVEEPVVSLPGSELVMGVGGLLHQAGAARSAAAVLREDARRRVAARLRLAAEAPPEEVAAAATAAGVERAVAEAALTATLPDDDRDLVALAATVERLLGALDGNPDRLPEGTARV